MQVLMLGSLFLSLKFRVLALEQLKLGEPLVYSVCDLRPTDVALHLNDRYICFESVEVCLLAFMPAILLGMTPLDAFDADAQAEPPEAAASGGELYSQCEAGA
jgi:hypothetical protein